MKPSTPAPLMDASMNPNDNNGDSVPKLDPRTARSQLRAKVQGFGRALDRATSEGAAVGKAALRVIVSDLARAVLDELHNAVCLFCDSSSLRGQSWESHICSKCEKTGPRR